MQNAERNERVLAILTRRDEIETEITEYNGLITTLAQERTELDAELTELMGVQLPLPLSNGTRGQRTCKFKLPDGTICGDASHDSRFHKET